MMPLFDSWCWKMAWRDSRAHRSRLFLFLGCICLGVAALVALRSFGTSVKEGIIEQSKSLLGADLLIKSRSPHPPKFIERLKKISTEDIREWRFTSMAKFPNQGKSSRFVQVRGVEHGFPIYGEVETEPAKQINSLFDGSKSALLDETLKIQFSLKVGDKIEIGALTFTITGFIKSLPGENFMVSELAPRVIIPFKDIPNTKLITFGSRVFYRHYYKYSDEVDEKELIPELEDAEIEHGIYYETVNDRQEAVDKTLSNLFHFLNLVAFIALLLGGIGIGSAIRVHINSKLQNAAVLRCLGASRSQAMTVYVIQSFCMGALGGLVGAILGTVLQQFLPTLLSAILPLKVETSFSLEAFLLGIGIGTVITLLFSITPLLKLNRMTAKESLSSSLSIEKIKTKWSWLVSLLLISMIIGFSIMSSNRIKVGIFMGLALIAALGMLIFMAWLLMKAVKKFIPGLLPFIWRQGLKNLYRPRNQTLTLVCSLGAGTFLIAVLYLTQENMLHQVRKTEEGSNPNVVLFDIQKDQIKEVNSSLDKLGLKPIDTIPLVGLKLTSINDRDVKSIAKENKGKGRHERIPNWSLQRTYRVTYRDRLNEGETIKQGEFIGNVDLDDSIKGKKLIPISVAEELMVVMKLTIGDRLTFDLGGVQVPCVISSVRKIEWMQMRPNFFVVFPAGVLEKAPQMIIMVTKTDDQQSSVKLQAEITKKFYNISVIDLTMIVQTVNNMLDKATLAIKVMAIFSILTGLIILISSLHLSQMQRLKDNTLLKVLGASKKQVIRILLSEFCFLAILSANAGTALAYAGNWALGEYVFENHGPFNWSVLLYSNLILLSLTVIIGLLVSAKTYKKTSLEVLRAEQ